MYYATVYSASGVKQPLTVAIPTAGAATGGAPTGIIANATTDFVIAGGPAAFMLKDEDRCIRCGLCAERCPTGAMTMDRYETSAAGVVT